MIRNKPLLSILIPTYCYLDGLIRILSSLTRLPVEECQVIVFDDSPDNEIEAFVALWQSNEECRLTYWHNKPPNGAPANWNSLLASAEGEYCLLLHHDEFPLGSNFVDELLHTLRQNPDTDVLILDCVLVAPESGRSRRHVPTWLRAFVVNHTPDYLLRRNVIGPTSTAVIRRSLYPRFDVELRWLVDAEMYVRLLKRTKRVRFSSLCVGSILGRSDSITARIRPSISKIVAEERAYLRKIHPSADVWLSFSLKDSPTGFLVRFIESVCWITMRLVTRALAVIPPYAVPRSIVRQSLDAPRKQRRKVLIQEEKQSSHYQEGRKEY